MVLQLFHLLGIVGWLGAAAADVVIEALLKRARSPIEQRTLIRAHAMTDLFVEGPGLIATGITGFIMLHQRGWLSAGASWPTWFKWKIAAAIAVLVTNTFALWFVRARYRASLRVPEDRAPLDDPAVARWARLGRPTFIGVPLSIVALVLVGLYGL